ncbi:MAG: ABC transporter ATP-binding protein [Planctomycetes bacterium]|nr:ABC transporter ATP-binding protein [Planctomycetota bacterium]
MSKETTSQEQPGKSNKLDWLNVRKAFGFLGRLWPFLKPQWPQLLICGVGMILLSAGSAMRVTAIRPFVELTKDVSKLTDTDLESMFRAVAPMAFILGAGGLMMAVGTLLKQYFMGYAQANTRILLQKELVRRLLAQPMAYFNTERKGALMSRLTVNAGGASTLVKLAIDDLVHHPISIIFLLGVMVYTSPLLTLATLIVFPMVLGPVMLFAGKIRRATKKKFSGMEDQGNFFVQMFDGIRVIKAFRLNNAQTEEFSRVSREVFLRERRVARYKGLARAGIEASYNLILAGGFGLIAWMLTQQWFRDQGGFPMFMQFFVAVIFLYDPARRFGNSLNEIQDSTTALDKVFELYDKPPEPADPPTARDAPVDFKEIEFDHVGFEYVAGRPVLADVTCKVARGQMIAFVGQSGMGKSTLMDLIPRFYDPVAGAIRVDGIDLREVKRESWLSRISMVSQETFLFNTTIRHNIMTGRPDATEAEVIESAKAANIWDEIKALPQGLDTKLGDRGVNLSGGQRQRVAIARAFLKKAPILLLDEATSNLDTRSEREVQNALDHLVAGCTVFVVAHRLSTIRKADQILVFHQGHVVERGTHAELAALGGHYASALQLQQGEPEPVAERVASDG